MHSFTHLLAPGEQVVHVARFHPVVYLKGAKWLLLAIICVYLLPPIYREGGLLADINLALLQASGFTFSQWVAGIFCLIGAIKLVHMFLLTHYTTLVVTNVRVIGIFGISRITTIEIERVKMASVLVHQSLLGKWLNYGKITLRGFSHTISGLPELSNPFAFQRYSSQQ
jgi:hypothetical protein